MTVAKDLSQPGFLTCAYHLYGEREGLKISEQALGGKGRGNRERTSTRIYYRLKEGRTAGKKGLRLRKRRGKKEGG